MGEEEKKKPLVSKYSTMKAGDLLKLIDLHHGDSVEALAKKKQKEDDTKAVIDRMNGVEVKYFISKRGEHGTHKGKPKSYGIKGKVEAEELLYNIALDTIKQDLGDSVVSSYKKDPHKLQAYINGRLSNTQVSFHALREEMVRNPRNFRESNAYKTFRQNMVHLDDLVEAEKVELELISDHNHYDAILGAANKMFAAHGKKVKEGTNARKALAHYKAGTAKEINNNYIDAHKEDLKDLEKKKK